MGLNINLKGAVKVVLILSLFKLVITHNEALKLS